MSLANYVTWQPAGRIFICLICHVGVYGPGVKAHFNHHHTRIVPKEIRAEIKDFIASYRNLYHHKQSEVVALANYTSPVPELAPPKVIFQCRVCQVFLTKGDQTIRKHSKGCLETYPHTQLDPRDLCDPASPSSFRYQTCLAQTWDEGHSAINRWWIVQGTPTVDPASSSSISPSSLDEQDQRELAEAAAQELAEYRPTICQPSFSVDRTNPWTKRTRWDELFHNRPHILIGRTKLLPHRLLHKVKAWESQDDRYPLLSSREDEVRLYHVMSTINRLLIRLLDTFDHTEHLHKVWLNNYKCSVNAISYDHPIRRLDKPETHRAYLNCFKQLICYVMRIFRFPQTLRDQIYTFSFSRRENDALRAIWRYLDQVFPNIGSTDDVDLDDEPEIDIEIPPTDDVDQQDLVEIYLDEDEMDEEEAAAVDSGDILPENPTQEQDYLDENNPISDLHPVDTTAASTPVVTDSEIRLMELVFTLAMSLWTSPFRTGNPYEGAAGHFLAALGIDVINHGFRTAHTYTPYLSGLGWITQLLFLEYALPYSTYPDLGDLCLPRHRYREPTKRIRRIRSTYMLIGRNYPLSELWSLRNFGCVIHHKEPPRAQLKWSIDKQEVGIDNGRITMPAFRGWVQSHVQRTYDNLRSLLRGFAPASMDLTRPFDLHDVHDRHVNSDHQYCFRNEPLNGLKDRWIEFSRHRRATASDSADSLYQPDQTSLNRDALHAYLDEHLSFLKWDLLPTCHTTGGSPARGPEINSVKLFNPSSDIFRNVFVYNGHLNFLTEYHKARSRTNFSFYVARFFPPVVSRLLYTYIVYVRPCVERLAANVHQPPETAQAGVPSTKATTPYLFTDVLKRQTFWHTPILTNALKATSMSLDISLAVHNYRHIAVGIMRTHVFSMTDPLRNRHQRKPDLLERPHIFQTAHSPHTDSHYAMDQEYQTKCQPSVLNAYFEASQSWWRWLNIDEYDFMLTQDPSQDDQASSIVPTLVVGTIPPPSAPMFTFDGEEDEASSIIPTSVVGLIPPSSAPTFTFDSSIVPTSVVGTIPSSPAPTFTFDGEEDGDTIIVDSIPFPDHEPVRPTKIEVIIPRKPTVTKRKASLSSISQEEHTSSSGGDEIEITIPRKRVVTKRQTSLLSTSQEEYTSSSEDDEIKTFVPRKRAATKRVMTKRAATKRAVTKRAVTKRTANLSFTPQEEHTSSSENDEMEVTAPRKPAMAKRKASLSSIAQEEHTSSSEDYEPIRIHRYKRIRVEHQSSITPSSSPSTTTRVLITERRHSPEELTFSMTNSTLFPIHQPGPTKTDPESSEPESFAAFCARRAQDRVRAQLTLPPTTVGLDARQSVEGFARPSYPSPSRCSGMMHAMSSPAPTSPVGPAASPTLQTPLEPAQLSTRRQPSNSSTPYIDHTDFVRRLRAAYSAGNDAVMSLISEEMDTWNRQD